MTYPRDVWANEHTDVFGEQMVPGLRNRRRFALWQASLLAEQPTADTFGGWETTVPGGPWPTTTPQRPPARELVTQFGQFLGQASHIGGARWVFKGIHAVAGLHAPMWSLFLAPANPQRIIVCFDALPGLSIEYGDNVDGTIERVLLADCAQQLCDSVSAALGDADPQLAVFPPRARDRAQFLAAEVTGQPYPYVLPDATRSSRRPTV